MEDKGLDLKVSSETAEKINALGNDMIMSGIATKEQQAQLANLGDALEEAYEEADKETTSAAVGGSTNLADMAKYIRKTRPMVRNYKVGRNEPCPCGSGKKYKNCCLNNGTYEGYHTV